MDKTIIVGPTGTKEKKNIHAVDTDNWENNYNPEVKFSISRNNSLLHLKYYVNEKYIRALVTEPNGPVHTDSCVEFFCAPDNNNYYYNFEFNCIGTMHLAYGNSRHGRKKAPLSVLEDIRVNASLGNKPFPEKEGVFIWSLYITIPIHCFFRHKIKSFEEQTMTGNFYKCGDKLTRPHYLSWNPVRTEKPDFHRPEFFGKLRM
jgi:hypothetical protein